MQDAGPQGPTLHTTALDCVLTERRLPPPVPKKPHKVVPHHHPPLARDRSLESSEKQRQEARKRLMAAKRAASVRQNSATESADSIEIYIPEAQTSFDLISYARHFTILLLVVRGPGVTSPLSAVTAVNVASFSTTVRERSSAERAVTAYTVGFFDLSRE
ncbi:hypothetical protein CCH79_00017343, partial [Gambusia affinis]